MIDLIITFTPEFKRMYKRLAKKYISLEIDMRELFTKLEQEPTTGTPLGENAYKIRLAISSKNKGKSGGARVITYYLTEDNELYLLSIYDKSELSSISDKMLKSMIKSVIEEK